MRNFILKRYYSINVVSDSIDNTTLYWFSDASKLAYGAFVYIRSIQSSGNVAVNLVTFLGYSYGKEIHYSMSQIIQIIRAIHFESAYS